MRYFKGCQCKLKILHTGTGKVGKMFSKYLSIKQFYRHSALTTEEKLQLIISIYSKSLYRPR